MSNSTNGNGLVHSHGVKFCPTCGFDIKASGLKDQPNFCPSCSCNLKAVGLALNFSAFVSVKSTSGKIGVPAKNVTPTTPRLAPAKKKARVPITQELRDKVKTLREQGKTAKQIAAEIPMSLGSVNCCLYYKSSKSKVAA